MDRQQMTDDRQQNPATSFKMDDVQEDNIVPRSNLAPQFLVGGVVVGFILTIVALAIHIANPPPEHPESNIVYLDDENFEEQAVTGIVLVCFYADWCGPCQMMIPAIESVATRFKERAVVARVNGEISRRLANQFRVEAYPTSVLLKDGQEVFQVRGFQAEHELVLLLETAINQQL